VCVCVCVCVCARRSLDSGVSSILVLLHPLRHLHRTDITCKTPNASQPTETRLSYIRSHAHTHACIQISVCVCVCVCVLPLSCREMNNRGFIEIEIYGTYYVTHKSMIYQANFKNVR